MDNITWMVGTDTMLLVHIPVLRNIDITRTHNNIISKAVRTKNTGDQYRVTQPAVFASPFSFFIYATNMVQCHSYTDLD